MGFKLLKLQILRGSLAKRLLLRILFFALAMVVISFTQIAHDIRTMEPIAMNFDKCSLNLGSESLANHSSAFTFPFISSFPWARCDETENITSNVFKELMEKNLLDSDSKSLCVGEDSESAIKALHKSAGVSDAVGIHKHPFFSLARKRFIYSLDFTDNHFDFVFSRAIDRVSVPALLVLEIERVLKPGGTGAILIGGSFYNAGLIRSVIPVSSFLRNSEIIHVCGMMGSYTLIIFKKIIVNRFILPKDCPSSSISIKPLNILSRNRLVYISINAGEFMTSEIVKKIYKMTYPMKPQAFNAYVIENDASALSAYVKEPGITFVYHPGMGGGERVPSSSSSIGLGYGEMQEEEEDEFDFILWFKETVMEGDFVVLIMNGREVELKILFQMFESGAICKTDEVMVRCEDCGRRGCGECEDVFAGLRKSGVSVHRWTMKEGH